MKIFTWKQRVIVWMTTVVTVVVAGGAGYGLDVLLGTHNIFFILGLVVSFPINAYMVKRNILKYGIELDK